MCGIIGLLLADENQHVNQLLFDGLTVLQHRGQDAAGMVTVDRVADGGGAHGRRRLHLRKDNGLVKDVFQTHHMMELTGHVGIGHCRYPTAGTAACAAEAQPLYTNYPYGICVAHNGNLINTEELAGHLQGDQVRRHVNTDSDSELLLNIFAEELASFTTTNGNLRPPTTNGSSSSSSNEQQQMAHAIFRAMEKVMQRCRGGYAGLYLINGFGLVGFRDPHGIRPLVFGCRGATPNGGVNNNDAMEASSLSSFDGCTTIPNTKMDYVLCSESVAIDTLGFQLIRDVRAGEAIFMDMEGNYHSRLVAPGTPPPQPAPCIFEYVYFARPDSIMDGISVYETRLEMGAKLASKIKRLHPNHEIDVVIPIPDTSRTCALQAAYCLDRPFREGFIKNRYIARTFIMPGQATRRKSVRLKLNTIKSEFAGRNVLLVDDSIVRGTTASEIVQMAKDAGARKVFFCSAAPPIRFPNIYGIDIPTRTELIAYQRNEEEIARKIGSDWVVYQDLKDLEDAVRECAPAGRNMQGTQFDTSCFSGVYVTGETIDDVYFNKLHDLRNDEAKQKQGSNGSNGHHDEAQTVTNGSGNHESTGAATQAGTTANGSSPRKATLKRVSSSGDCCESMSNDTRVQSASSVACEPLTNQPFVH